jgi:hypothetical protein
MKNETLQQKQILNAKQKHQMWKKSYKNNKKNQSTQDKTVQDKPVGLFEFLHYVWTAFIDRMNYIALPLIVVLLMMIMNKL